MKIGVMADSHDHVERIERAVKLFSLAGVERVLHAGDFIAPFAVLPLASLGCPVVGVLGNNDGEVLGLTRAFEKVGQLHPQLASLELGGRRVAMNHYPELAEPLAAGGGFDLVVFGHTHRLLEQRIGSTLLLNPGEVCGWLTGRPTAAVVDLATLAVEVLEL